MNAESNPIIVGVGQMNDRPHDVALGRDSVDLIVDVLLQAQADAGCLLLDDADFLAVVRQISFRG